MTPDPKHAHDDRHEHDAATERAEAIVNWLDAYLNRRELVANSTEGWFTSADVDDARRELVEALAEALR